MLNNFKGYLQTDGYATYEKFGKKKDITHLTCWSHARCEFEKALQNVPGRAKKTLLMIQDLYKVGRNAKEEKRSPDKIKNTLPKSQIGKAIA